jgi:PTS system nitrogen regulatory IIA component
VNINARAAARLLSVPESRIYEWVSSGDLPCHRVQDQLRFNRVELLEWAAARRLKIAPELFEDERRPGGNGSGLRLSQALRAGGVHRDIAGDDARAVLGAIARRLPVPEGVDREQVAALFAARQGLTPVGGGIAIPHARSPVVLPEARPTVALAFLARPIEVAAGDGKPVQALFVVFSPAIRVHLEVLSKIASALADESFHGLVERRAGDAEIFGRLAALEAGRPSPAPEASA